MTNERYLIGLGFKRDNTCPEGVIRYELCENQARPGRKWISVTLNKDRIAIYGVANFYSSNIPAYIYRHRSFNCPILETDFAKFIDEHCENLPEYVDERIHY